LRTTRCVVGRAALAGVTVCVGAAEPGGLVVFGRPGFRSGLPARGGFRDVALHPTRARLYVLDSVDPLLWVLDGSGAVRAHVPVPDNGYRIGWLGDDHLWLAAWTAPLLAVVPVGDEAASSPGWVEVPRTAPARDAVWDEARDLLWLVGPEDALVRRDKGPIRHLRTVLQAYRCRDLLAGGDTQRISNAAPQELMIGDQGVVDGARVATDGRAVVVTATGSDSVAVVTPRGETWEVRRIDAGLGPAGLLARPGGFVVANRLDDSVWFYALDREGGEPALAQAITLGTAARDTPRDLGERLFHGTFLWRHPTGEAYTCNGCHWDGGSDHRVHPGFEERRHEVTRPLGGIAAVRPVFSTGGAPSLTDAVEGLVRGLDARFYHPEGARGAWWDAEVQLPVKGGGVVTLAARDVRRALLEFLMELPVEPGPLRLPGQPFSLAARRGWELFARDCAACHEPTRDMSTRERIHDDVLAALRDAPATFAVPGWARTGVTPYFNQNGTRVAPLRELGRGGPWFTNGKVHTLTDLLARCRPGTSHVHGGGDETAGTAAYGDDDLAALRAFLLSI
jgi:hypothetical protein